MALFPGLARSLLAVRNSRRRPGLVHHVICLHAQLTSRQESMMSYIDVLAQHFTLKEAPRDHSGGSCVS